MSVHFSMTCRTSAMIECGMVTDIFKWQTSMKLIDTGMKNSEANSTPATDKTRGGTLGIMLPSEDSELMLSRGRIDPVPAVS